MKELTAVAEGKTDTTYFVLIGNSNQHALDYFGLKKESTPAFVIQSDNLKYLKQKVSPKEAAGFYKDFLVRIIEDRNS